MPKITFITPSGDAVEVSGDYETLMEAAVDHGVEGIEAQCGGVCSCATCHVRIKPDWIERAGLPEDIEQDMLELYYGSGPGSRLSCQVNLSPELDGIVVEVVPLEP